MDAYIDLAKQFSPYPAGRFVTDGDFNGERFRDDILVPALRKALESPSGKVVVDIDGVRSFGSSFLEEAFGGLIRKRLFTRKEVREHLAIKAAKQHLLFYKTSIYDYLNDAVPSSS